MASYVLRRWVEIGQCARGMWSNLPLRRDGVVVSLQISVREL